MSKVDELVAKLGRTYVAPHPRVVDGKVQHVSGYWRETKDKESLIPTSTDAAASLATSYQMSQFRQTYDSVKKIYDAEGYDAAGIVDQNITEFIASQKDVQPSWMVTDPEQIKSLKGMLANTPQAHRDVQKFVQDKLYPLKIEKANPKLRATVMKAADTVAQEPLMRRMTERYGAAPLYVAPGFAHTEYLTSKKGRNIARAAVAENLDGVGIIFYDHSRAPKALKKFGPWQKDVPTPGQGTGGSSYENVYRHEYGHTIFKAEKKYRTDWATQWLESWKAYRTSVELSPEYTKDQSIPPGVISMYSAVNPDEGFSEAFATVMNPNWRPEMAKQYSPTAQRLLALAQRLIDMEPRDLTKDYIDRWGKGKVPV